MTFKDKMASAIESCGLCLGNEAYEKLEIYMRLLIEWNEKMNLTSIIDEDGIIFKHFADSLILLNFESCSNAKLIDIGTGAGFPGIPLKIADGSIKLTLLDSLKKRALFLEAVKAELGLNDLNIVSLRAEDGARLGEYRQRYDLSASRAVARMNVLCEYCLPYVRQGGRFVAYKGYDIEDELKEAEATITKLGGKIAKVEKILINNGEFSRSLIFIDKISQTPNLYPRNPRVIAKKSVI